MVFRRRGIVRAARITRANRTFTIVRNGHCKLSPYRFRTHCQDNKRYRGILIDSRRNIDKSIFYARRGNRLDFGQHRRRHGRRNRHVFAFTGRENFRKVDLQRIDLLHRHLLGLVVRIENLEAIFFNRRFRFAFTQRNRGKRNDIPVPARTFKIPGDDVLIIQLDSQLLGKVQSDLFSPASFLGKVPEIDKRRRKLILSR